MRILLLGATGRTGKWVLHEALKMGHQVHALVRKPEALTPHPNLTIFVGNAAESSLLQKAIKGCEAVISVLNISRTSDFPWAKLRTPKTFLSDVMKNLIPLAIEENVQRVIICSAWGVAESKAEIPAWFRWLINNSNISYPYVDHARQEKLLRASSLPYTIIRPTGLTNGKKKPVQEHFANTKPKLTISRKSLAHYMLEALNNEPLINKIVTVSNL